MPGRPPRAERVLEQEADHVVLGEELGHRRDVGAADLALGGVDLLLLLRLPELVDPAERVVGGEHLAREAGEDLLQRVLALRREPQLQHGSSRRKIPGSIAAANALATTHRSRAPAVVRELLAVGERDRDAVLRVDQQVVLGQEPGEQHPVPLLVRALLDQALEAAELPRLRAQAPPAADDRPRPRCSGARSASTPRTPSATRLAASAASRAATIAFSSAERSSDERRSAQLTTIGPLGDLRLELLHGHRRRTARRHLASSASRGEANRPCRGLEIRASSSNAASSAVGNGAQLVGPAGEREPVERVEELLVAPDRERRRLEQVVAAQDLLALRLRRATTNLLPASSCGSRVRRARDDRVSRAAVSASRRRGRRELPYRHKRVGLGEQGPLLLDRGELIRRISAAVGQRV